MDTKKVIIILFIFIIGGVGIWFVLKKNKKLKPQKKSEPDTNFICNSVTEGKEKCESLHEIDTDGNKLPCYFYDDICNNEKPRHGICLDKVYVRQNKDDYMDFVPNTTGKECGKGNWVLNDEEKYQESGSVVQVDKIGGRDMMDCCPLGSDTENIDISKCWNFDDYSIKDTRKPCPEECGIILEPKINDIITSNGNKSDGCTADRPVKINITNWISDSKSLYQRGRCNSEIIKNSILSCGDYNNNKASCLSTSDCDWYDAADNCNEFNSGEECDNSKKGCYWESGISGVSGSCKPVGKCSIKSEALNKSSPFMCCKRTDKQQECFDRVFENTGEGQIPKKKANAYTECKKNNKCKWVQSNCVDANNCPARCIPSDMEDKTDLVDCDHPAHECVYNKNFPDKYKCFHR
jgi:hypothetical protein